MSQALHIFKKDLGHLRLEIALFIALTVVYAWTEFRQANQLATWALLAVAAIYLIARVIHAEAIPGDCQFWISRPYRWRSLLGAKLLFILVIVNLPVFTARLVILLLGDFPLAVILPGLLWSHFLIFFVFSLVTAMVAALTTGPAPFIFSALVLLAAALGVQSMIGPLALTSLRTLVNPIQWVWDAMAAIALVAVAVPIIWIQYRSRKTRFSRVLAIAVAVSVAAAYVYMPWTVAFAVQEQVFNRAIDSTRIHVVPNEWHRAFVVPVRGPEIALSIPIEIADVPSEMSVEINALVGSFYVGKNLVGKSSRDIDMGAVQKASGPEGRTSFNAMIRMPAAVLSQVRQQSIKLDASIYLTVYGNPQTATIPLTKTPVNVMDGLQCAADMEMGAYRVPSMYCKSLFRTPSGRVYAKFDESDTRQLARIVSYSPFPSELSLENVFFTMTSTPDAARQATIVTTEPLKSMRLDFEVPNIQLLDSQPAKTIRE